LSNVLHVCLTNNLTGSLTVQTLYVPDKDYVWSEPPTPPSPQCSPSSRGLDHDNSTETDDKSSDSTGMLNFTYPVSYHAVSLTVS